MPGLCSGGGRVLKFRFDWPIDGMGWKRDCNNFVQNTATSKGHLAIASIGHENKFHVCNISNRHQYGSTNHRDSPQDKNRKRMKEKTKKKNEKRKALEPDSWLALDSRAEFDSCNKWTRSWQLWRVVRGRLSGFVLSWMLLKYFRILWFVAWTMA